MNIETECLGSTLTITLSGELDHHAASGVLRAMELALDTHLPRAFLLDFKGVTFMDSSGIAVILKARRRMEELGGELRVVNVAERPRRILEAAGLSRIVNIQREVHT